MNVSAIILAGGNSSRMKYDKEFIKIGDEFLVHKQIKKLRRIFEEIIIVSNNPEHYEGLNVRVVGDILEGKTPIIGLHAGLVNSNKKYNYCIACDMAYINIDFIKHMVGLIDNHDAYVAIHQNFIEPFNAIYSKNIVSTIESFVAKKNLGFQRLIKELNTYYIGEKKISFFQQEYDMFKNINNEKDLIGASPKDTASYQQLRIQKMVNHETFVMNDKVITEYPLSLYINDIHYSTIMMTPEDIEFMITGYLHSEYIISHIDHRLVPRTVG